MTYIRVDEIRKNMDHFLHIQNDAILLNPLKVQRIPCLTFMREAVRTSDIHERGVAEATPQTLEALSRPPQTLDLIMKLILCFV